MKKKLYHIALLFSATMILAACGGSSSKTAEEIDDQLSIEFNDVQNAAVDDDNTYSAPEEKDDAQASEDWDSVLNEYEEYVDNYIRLYKKAMSGDLDAMTEYASMLESAQRLSEKLENANSEMTPQQAKRYTKISQKLAKAAL